MPARWALPRLLLVGACLSGLALALAGLLVVATGAAATALAGHPQRWWDGADSGGPAGVGGIGLHSLAAAVSEPDGRFTIGLRGHELATLLEPLVAARVAGGDSAAAGVAVPEVVGLDVQVLPGSPQSPARLRLDVRVRPSASIPDLVVPVHAHLGLSLVAGVVDVAVEEVAVGALPVPSAAQRPLSELTQQVVDVAAALEDAGVQLEGLRSDGQHLLLQGRTALPLPITRERLELLVDARTGGGDATNVAASGVLPPRGRLTSRSAAAGTPWVLAMGDSVAAGLGVDDLRDSVAARVHAGWERRTGRVHGLRNIARVGERTDTLRWGGQLPQAEAFLAAHPVDLVVLSLGANDVLTELTAPACQLDWSAVACRDHLAVQTARARADLAAALDRIRGAAPEARVVLLTSYNPLSFGTAAALERQAQTTLGRMADALAEVAAERGVAVASGLAALDGLADEVTGLLRQPPDIHPDATGHGLLAAEVLRALDAALPPPDAGEALTAAAG